jgi:hypothetical protein
VLGARFDTKSFVDCWRHRSLGRQLAAKAVAWDLQSAAAFDELEPRLRAEIMVDLHHRWGTYLQQEEAQRRIPREGGFGWRVSELRTWWHADVEDALAALVEDSSAELSARIMALRSLSTWIGMPTPPFKETPAPEEAKHFDKRARGLLEHWRHWRSLPRAEALHKRIEFLFARLNDSTSNRPKEIHGQVANCLRRWLGRHQSSSEKELRAYWEARRELPAEQWLRADLSLDEDEPVEVAEALLHAALNSGRHMLWRHLAWLRLADKLRVPEFVESSDAAPISQAWSPVWRRAVGIRSAPAFIARLGIVMFDGATSPPQLLGEIARPIAFDEPRDLLWRGPIPSDFGPRVYWRSFGQDARIAQKRQRFAELSTPLRHLTAFVDCELRAGTSGPKLQVRDHHLSARVPMEGGNVRGRSFTSHGGRPGEAWTIKSIAYSGGGLGREVEFLFLLRLDPIETGAEPGELDDWLDASIRTLGWAVKPAESAYLALPARWPMPAAAKFLRRLRKTYHPGLEQACLLAGSHTTTAEFEQRLAALGYSSDELFQLDRIAMHAPDPVHTAAGTGATRIAAEARSNQTSSPASCSGCTIAASR